MQAEGLAPIELSEQDMALLENAGAEMLDLLSDPRTREKLMAARDARRPHLPGPTDTADDEGMSGD